MQNRSGLDREVLAAVGITLLEITERFDLGYRCDP